MLKRKEVSRMGANDKIKILSYMIYMAEWFVVHSNIVEFKEWIHKQEMALWAQYNDHLSNREIINATIDHWSTLYIVAHREESIQ
jgi:hypothetical protein